MSNNFKPNKTILFSQAGKPDYRELPAGTQATASSWYPGAFVPYSGSSPATALKQNASTYGTGSPLMMRPVFSVEQDWQGINSPTTPGDTVKLFKAQSGDRLYINVATGATYSPGALLKPTAGATYGALSAKAATGATASCVAIALTTLATASAKVTVSKIGVEVI